MSVDASSRAPGTHAGGAAQAADDAAVRAERIIAFLRGAAIDLWRFLRFLPFVVFLAFLVLSFWLAAFTAAIAVVRAVLRLVAVILLGLSGGLAPRRGTAPPGTLRDKARRELRLLRVHASLTWEESVGPFRRHWRGAGYGWRMFWHWHIGRKLLAVITVALLIVLPWFYFIPRPYDVQVTDDNAIDYQSDGQIVRYLVHAVDLNERNQTREFMNEDAWWLGKINAQVIKSQIQEGRYYRMWVVGIRWWKWPTLYPNIIRAQEIDEHGRRIENPSLLRAAPVVPENTTPLLPATPLEPDAPVEPVQAAPPVAPAAPAAPAVNQTPKP
ncbi:MAG: hypothetical protein AB7O67_17900 [Vicinamibacterales bacterium]